MVSTSRLCRLLAALLLAAFDMCAARKLPPRADLCADRAVKAHKQRTDYLLAAKGHKRTSKKTVHLHDIARNDSRNEYFAGGQDEEGRGSATVLIYPDEDKMDENKTDAEEPEPEPPKSKMTGTGRKL